MIALHGPLPRGINYGDSSVFRIGNTSRMASLLFMPLCCCIVSCLVFQWVFLSKSHFYIMLPSQNDWTFSAMTPSHQC